MSPALTSRFFTTSTIWEDACISDITRYLLFSFWLTSLSMTVSRSIHINCKWHYFILFKWLTFHCIYVPYHLYPSVDGRLDCFHVPPIVNSATVNIRVQVSFWIIIFFGYIIFYSFLWARSGIPGSYGSSIFSFWRTAILFSIVAVPIYIPTNGGARFPFPHTLSSIYHL